MDEKYIENLGMSAHVDEGLWDRLKSRASSIAQGAKNISGGRLGSVGTTEAAKFNSLFRNFVAEELAIIKSLDKAVVPWAKHFNPEEVVQIQQIETLEQALKKIDFGKLPVTEALPSFGNLGARWAGGVQNMLDSYKKRIASTYDSFINDVRKLNIVPDQYISRKIASSKSGAYEALKALEPVIGKSATTGIPTPSPMPVPAPPAASTAASTPAPVPSEPPASPAASAPIPAAPKSPEKSAATEPESPKPSSPPSGTELPTASPVSPIPAILAKKAIDKIIGSLTKGQMADKIGGYITRDASKAEAVFPAEPPVSVTTTDGFTILWQLRYQASKEAKAHMIQVLAEKRKLSPTTGREEVVDRSDVWEDFINFGVSDVFTIDGKVNPKFDVMKLIYRTNPEFGKFIETSSKTSGITIDPSTNAQLANAFLKIIEASMPDRERGGRELTKPVIIDPEKVSSGPGTPPPPIEGPKAPETMINPSPETMGRVTKVPPTAAEPEKEPKKDPETSKISGSVSAPVSSSPSKKTEPSSKLKDLVPKKGKSKATSTSKKASLPSKPTPKSTPKPTVPDKAVAPVSTSEKKPAVAPVEPTPKNPTEPTKLTAPVSTAPLGGDEYLTKFNKKYIEPHGLAPLKNREELKKFNDAIGVTGSGDIPDWKIPGAYQAAFGTKPTAPAASASMPKDVPKQNPKRKMKEGIQYRDFFSL